MKEAGWQPFDVDLISANGSSSVLYDKLEATALREVFGNALDKVRVHSIKSTLGQHGAGSSALQAVGACLSIRRGVAPPTINHTDPDPECGGLRVVTEAEKCDPTRVLVHAIGLGGFYYSCAAFQAPAFDVNVTGRIQVKWSEGQGRFKPKGDFTGPLTPWKPRSD
jgi:3-oxoacyl-[acyl-carrier-protein] synthase II